jgi:hypothetical protein
VYRQLDEGELHWRTTWAVALIWFGGAMTTLAFAFIVAWVAAGGLFVR